MITCVKLMWKIRLHNVDVLVEADRADQSMFEADSRQLELSLLLSEDRASIDFTTRVKC